MQTSGDVTKGQYPFAFRRRRLNVQIKQERGEKKMSDSEGGNSIEESEQEFSEQDSEHDSTGYDHIVWLEEEDDEDVLPPLVMSTARRKRTLADFRAHPRMYGNTYRCKEFPHGVFIDEYGELQPDHPRSNIFWKKSEWLALHPEHATALTADDAPAPQDDDDEEEEVDSDGDACDDDPARSSEDEDEQFWKQEEEKYIQEKKAKKKKKPATKRKRKAEDESDYDPDGSEEEEEEDDDYEDEDGDEDDGFFSDEDDDYRPPTKRKKKKTTGEEPEAPKEDEEEPVETEPREETPEEARRRERMEKTLKLLKEEAESMERIHNRGKEQKALYLQSQKLNRKLDDLLTASKSYCRKLRNNYHAKDIPRVAEWHSNFLTNLPTCVLEYEWKRKGIGKVEVNAMGHLEDFVCTCGHVSSDLCGTVDHLIEKHLPSLTPLESNQKKKNKAATGPLSFLPAEPLTVVPDSLLQALPMEAEEADTESSDED